MRAGPGDGGGTILEAFKPGTAPPDNYSAIGVADADGQPRAHVPQGGFRPMPAASCGRGPGGFTSQLKASSLTRGAIALCARRRYIRVAVMNMSAAAPSGKTRETMRAEIERLVEEIKQSVGLLRRHL